MLFSVLALGSGALADQDAVRVFWTDKDDGQLEVADLDGSNRSTLLSGLADPLGIVVDSSGFGCRDDDGGGSN